MRLTLLVIFLTTFADAISQKQKGLYTYHIDLSNTVDDRVFVTLHTPKMRDKEVIFYMPKIVPGTYAIADYGRYVNNFIAYDKKGKTLDVQKLDVNTWKINSQKKLSRITYWVDDTFDTSVEGPEIFWPAGTNIEEGKNFIINTSGFFGYFKGKTSIPFEINITRPVSQYGSTGLVPVKALTKEVTHDSVKTKMITDVFRPENYNRLIDSPLMYNKADTAVIHVANAEVLIGSYSPNGVISAKEIAASIKEVLEAQTKYLGGRLPVNKYAFIFYFTDGHPMNYGALEHSYSSLYYLPEGPIEEINQELRDMAAHEFFHILTPLTVHSEEIAKFDFNKPEMSKHLWMYEGVTEYFASNVQVKNGLITPEEYIGVLYDKMTTADQFINDVPFTEISKNILDKYHDQFYNVYQKGALIGLCLDLKLRKLSSGKYGLRNLMLDLSSRYGKDKAFNDDELFDIIATLTYPEIKDFLVKYVAGKEPLPLKEVLEYVGIHYAEEEKTTDYSLGINSTDIDITEVESKPHLQIISEESQNEIGKALGFKKGDVLIAINDEPLPDLGPELGTFLGKHYRALPESKTLSYTVLRKNESGEWKEVKLSAPVKQISITRRHLIEPDPNATKEQLLLRDSWLK